MAYVLYMHSNAFSWKKRISQYKIIAIIFPNFNEIYLLDQ